MDKLRTSPLSKSGDERVGLWHKSLKQQRKGTWKKVLIAFGLITISMWLFLPIYFGSYYRQTENTHRLTTIILDLDSPAASLSTSSILSSTSSTTGYTAILGPAITSAAQSYLDNIAPLTNSTTWALDYQFPSEEELGRFALPVRDGQGGLRLTPGLDPEEWARGKVERQDVWAVVLVRGNATVVALQALQGGGGGEYDPQGSIGFFYSEARNFFTTNQYVVSQSVQLITSATQTASTSLISSFLSNNGGVDANALATLGETEAGRMVLTRPFGYSEYNLRPFDQLAGEAATTAGAIYLIIFVFFFTPMWTGVYSTVRTKLTLGSDILITILANLGYYFWISLQYSLLSLAFHVNFTRARGYGGFPMYWLINFVTMMALGFPMQIVFEILGQPYFPFFLVFWVIINVSVAFLDIADMDPFYSYGFAFPVWNNVDAAKHLFFNEKSHLVQNFAVNLSWAAISVILLICLVFYRRTKETKQAWESHRKELHPTKRQMRLVL